MKTLKILAIFVLMTFAFLYRDPIMNFLKIITDQQAVSAYLKSYGSLGPIVLFILLIAQVFIAFIPGHALMVTAGYVYGAAGLLVVITSTILGSQIAFLIARWYGRDLIHKLASPKVIDRWDGIARHQGILFYFFSFVLPIFPSDLMCYVAGLATISPRRFFVANVLGRTCCAVFITLIGIYDMKPPIEFWGISLLVISICFIGWAVYKRIYMTPVLKRNVAYTGGMFIAKAYQKIFDIRCEVKGMETLPDGPKIIAMNHTNVSDLVFLPLIFPKAPRLIVQGNLFNLPIIGYILRETGQIPVDPEKHITAFQQAHDLLKRNETILIFPEGRLVSLGQRTKACTGAVRLALAANVPIIPLGIYAKPQDVKALKVRDKLGEERKGFYQFRGKCRMYFGPAWRPDPSLRKPFQIHGMANELMDRIYSLVEEAERSFS